MDLRKFWIRRDREQYFLTGVLITCIIGGFVSSYWHFTDRIAVRRNIKLRKTATTDRQQRKLRDLQYTPVKLRVGNTQYYRLDGEARPAVPLPGENE